MKKHENIIKNLPKEDKDLYKGICAHADFLNTQLEVIEDKVAEEGILEMYDAEVFITLLSAYKTCVDVLSKALPQDRL